MAEWDLVDVIPQNGKFNWSNRKASNSHITANLDRFILHNSWILQDIDPHSSILASGESYNRPILLVLGKKDNLGLIHFH